MLGLVYNSGSLSSKVRTTARKRWRASSIDKRSCIITRFMFNRISAKNAHAFFITLLFYSGNSHNKLTCKLHFKLNDCMSTSIMSLLPPVINILHQLFCQYFVGSKQEIIVQFSIINNRVFNQNLSIILIISATLVLNTKFDYRNNKFIPTRQRTGSSQ